ncbi:ferredoxin [Nocardia miyunensis]|uniref:ferredoxin n=1 Tax=Nocardia miyunensis TaxID=282684 RepID=UPI000AD7463C|nr:ferredoxin [Nocardia miyunensis]
MNDDARLRFSIDTDICAGHGRCFVLAPDAFVSDDVGYGQVNERAFPSGERRAMDDIAFSCPEGAISIREITG